MFVSKHALLRRLSVAAVLLLMISVESIAQDIRSFDLDAGDADFTLKQFAKQARLSIVYDPRSVEGVQTQEVVGKLLPSEALERMLKGSSLVFEQDAETGAFAVTHSNVSSSDVVKLTPEAGQPIEETVMRKNNNWIGGLVTLVTLGIAVPDLLVNAQPENDLVVLDTFVVQDEDGLSYFGTRTTASDRTAMSVRDMPNTVNIMSRKFIEMLEPNNLVEALRLMPGVNANRPFTFGNQVEIRGFVINTNLIDGHFDNVNSPMEFIHIDRIEVLNGPASLLYGRTATVGGAINKVTKRPMWEQSGYVEVQVGQYDQYRLAVDATGPLSDKMAYRVMAATNSRGFEEDFAEWDSDFIRAALAWKPGENTYMEGIFQFADYTTVTPTRYYFFNQTDGSIVRPVKGFNLTEDRRVFAFEQTMGGLDIFHGFSDTINLRHSTRYQFIDRPIFNGVGFSSNNQATDGRTINRNYADIPAEDENFSTQTDLTFDFAGENYSHTLLLATEYTNRDATEDFELRSGVPSIDALNPDYGQIPSENNLDLLFTNRTFRIQQTWDLTMNLTSNFLDNRLTTTAGVKRSKFKADVKQFRIAPENRLNNAQVGDGDWEDTLRLGGSFRISSSSSVYASYSESYQPQATVNRDGSLIPPQVGEQTEIGLKSESGDGKVFFQAAIFNLERDNNFRPTGDNGAFVKEPAEEIEGLEMSFAWRPQDNFELIGSYTYLDAIEQASGERRNRVPRNQISLFGRYDLKETLEGLSIGLGVRWHDETRESVLRVAKANGVSNTEYANGFDVWNAYVAYKVSDRLSLQLNVENLLDEEYYPFWNGNSRIDVGEPRTAKITARYRW